MFMLSGVCIADTVVWARERGIWLTKKAECWFDAIDDLSGAMHVLYSCHHYLHHL